MIIAYFILRCALGLNLFLHGYVRLAGGPLRFAEALKAEYKGVLPTALVGAFAASLPFGEAAIGFLLLTGLFTHLALLTGSAILFVLLFGKSLKSDWQTVSFQMIYVAFYAALEAGLLYNQFSLDALLNR